MTGGKPMFWPFSIYDLVFPKERYIWAQIRILRESDKTILVDNGVKIWIPKSRIHGIKLKNNISKIHVKEITVE